MRQRVLRAIRMILHGHRGQLLARGPVLMHMPPGDHREKGRKCRPSASLAGHIPRPGQDLGDLGRRLRGHLFDPRYQDDIVQPRRDARNRMKKGRAAGGAGRLKAGTWYSGESQASGDIRSQVVLAHKGGSGKVAEVETLDL